MAIRASVQGARISSDKLLKLTAGKRDEYGNPFQIIELVSNQSGVHPYRIGGFDDADINFQSGSRTPVIRYIKEGSAKFEPDEIIPNQLVAQIPRTPRNMDVLAATYKDLQFTIVDEEIRKEVEEMSNAIVEDPLTKKRRKDMTMSRLDENPIAQTAHDPKEAAALKDDLRKIEEQEPEKVKLETEKEETLAEGEMKYAIPTEEELRDHKVWTYTKLQKKAKELDVYMKDKPTRENLMKAILGFKGQDSEKEETPAGA